MRSDLVGTHTFVAFWSSSACALTLSRKEKVIVSLQQLFIHYSVESLQDNHKKHVYLAFRVGFEMKVNKTYSDLTLTKLKEVPNRNSCFKLPLYILCTK